jgi:site-specific DNA-cytosine methylase
MVIDAELFLPQSRKRVFIVAIDNALSLANRLWLPVRSTSVATRRSEPMVKIRVG